MPRTEAAETLSKRVKTLDDFQGLKPLEMEILLLSEQRPDIPIESLAQAFIQGKLEALLNNPNGTSTPLIAREITRHRVALNGGKGLADYFYEEAERRSEMVELMRLASVDDPNLFEGGAAFIQKHQSQSDGFLGIAIDLEQIANSEPTYAGSLKRD